MSGTLILPDRSRSSLLRLLENALGASEEAFSRYQKGSTLPAASRASLGDLNLNLMITFGLRLPPMHALLCLVETSIAELLALFASAACIMLNDL